MRNEVKPLYVSEYEVCYREAKPVEVDPDLAATLAIRATSPSLAGAVLLPVLEGSVNERMVVLGLNSQTQIVGVCEVAHGSVNTADIKPRRIVSFLLQQNASACILAHNHPGGNPEPSTQDTHMTERIGNLLVDLDISLLDHLIFAQNGPAVSSMYSIKGERTYDRDELL